MYKTATDIQQRQARQLWLADLVPDVDWGSLSPAEQRANLVSAKQGIDRRLAALPKSSKLRKELGRQANEICMEINRLRPKKTSPGGTVQHFVDICRERMTKAQFAAIMSEAAKRAEAEDDNASNAVLSRRRAADFGWNEERVRRSA